MRYSIDPERHSRIFGPQEPKEGAGRSRRCRTCGGWHNPRAWPHNCMPPTYSKQRLAAPQIAPSFQPFVAGDVGEPEVIGSRNDKREYMNRNDLVEYDEGVGRNTSAWVEEINEENKFADDMKKFAETDTEADVWDVYHENYAETEGDLDTDGLDVQSSDIEVIE